MRVPVLITLLACHSGDAPAPRPDPAGAREPASTGSPTGSSPGASAGWSGDAIAPRTVVAEPTTFALGDDLTIAVATANGWLGTKLRAVGGDFLDDLVDARGVIGTVKSAHLIASGPATYVVVDTGDAPPRVSRLAGRKLVPLAGNLGVRWVFDNVAIANDTSGGLATQHWQTIAIDHDKLSVVETSDGPYATGAARVGADIVVAIREHDPPANVTDKADALLAAQNGDPASLARIVGQPRGWLMHVDGTGHVTSTEPFPDQTPGQVAATRSGYLVVATEGTTAAMFDDGLLLARAPKDPALHVLARGLASTSQLMAAGDWACLYTMSSDDTRVVHCVDPVRRLHVTSQALTDNVTLYGIELLPTPRLILHHSWARDGYAKPFVEETLALALP